ncbi:MAG: disulfide bond formation protein DsbD, partial [Rhodospirillaceae bacterium]|nr:disulfide bond formation protein DsbD [Rhodospirillaceae bacterium]
MNYERKSFGNFEVKTIFRFLIVILLSLSAVFFAPGKVFAASSSWWTTDQGAVRLIASSNAVGESSQLHLGLHFKMKPGWKIYWRSPGDAGFPPYPDWSGSENLEKMRIDWPAPTRFSVIGLETLGYKGEVVFPLTLKPLEYGKRVKIRSKVRYLTCDQICIPYEATLALSLPPGPEGSSPEAYLINEFRSRVPKKVKDHKSPISSVVVNGSPGKQVLRITTQTFEQPDLIIEGPPGFRFGKVGVIERKISGKMVFATNVFSSTRPSESGSPKDLVDKNITLTLLDGSKRGIEYQIKPRSAVLTKIQSTASLGNLIGIVALALLGGLILNLMPCVLPVLSLKLLSVIGYSDKSLGVVRKAFLASAMGILVSFLILGSAAVILKSFGQAVGWGIQFQQPVFLTAMSVVLVLFAANVWGLFEIRLPSFLTNRAVPAGGPQTMAGHFAAGVFAAFLATPCSAPFLGTAVGFALAHGPFEIYLIFVAL